MDESDKPKDIERPIEIPNRNIFKSTDYAHNSVLKSYINKYFKGRISKNKAYKLLMCLFKRQPVIFLDEFDCNTAGFLRNQKVKIEQIDGRPALTHDVQIYLFQKINDMVLEMGKKIPEYDEEKHKTIGKIENPDGSDIYVLNKYTTYEQVRKLICDDVGDALFTYNFKEPDIDITTPKNMDTLQRCQIQVLGNKVQFDFPIEYVYQCSSCGNRATRKAYEVISTGTRLKCDGVVPAANNKTKACSVSLLPDGEVSATKNAHFFFISYEDTAGNKRTAGAFSFKDFPPGFYEVALFRIKQPMKQEMFMIIDLKKIKSNDINLPALKQDENYIFTLQRAFDSFIHQQAGMNIYGLIPVKVAMILQTAFSFMLPNQLLCHIKLVGDPSTGKSTVFKFYGFLLNNHLHMSTNGLSISIPALRGTIQKIVLLGKEQSILTTGYLGVFRVIHIDEMGENPELMQHMKGFISETEYGYHKAGGDETQQKRTAQINVSQNLDEGHLGMYVGKIRKKYNDFNQMIGEEHKEDWDETWDLHLPIYEYSWNPYLLKVIKDVREAYAQEQKFWIDGYELALHQRFQLSFFLTNEKSNDELTKVVKQNVSGNTIKDNLELIRVLHSDNIDQFYKESKEFMDTKLDPKQHEKDLDGVDVILTQYGMTNATRIREFFYNILKLSKTMNKRNVANKQDYDLIRYLIENTNSKLDISDTNTYDIKGAPDIQKYYKEMNKIDDDVKDASTQFGLDEGEFE